VIKLARAVGKGVISATTVAAKVIVTTATVTLFVATVPLKVLMIAGKAAEPIHDAALSGVKWLWPFTKGFYEGSSANDVNNATSASSSSDSSSGSSSGSSNAVNVASSQQSI
jgi:hypothetical protein